MADDWIQIPLFCDLSKSKRGLQAQSQKRQKLVDQVLL